MEMVSPKKKLGIQFSENMDLMTLNDKKHFVEANLMALDEMKIAPIVKEPNLIPDKILQVKIEKHLNKDTDNRNVIGVCIGNADTTFKYKLIRKKPVYTKGWGISNMSFLCKELLNAGYKVVLIGGKQELPLLEQMPAEVKDNAISFVGKTTVYESIALASLCDVVVGVDTGMQHIADAVGTKTVSIFGPTLPKYTGAHSDKARFVEYSGGCRNCVYTSSYTKCKDRKCLNEISVQQVVETIKESLKEKCQSIS
jgi:ADP-heptose:LPS heptosyltransferase